MSDQWKSPPEDRGRTPKPDPAQRLSILRSCTPSGSLRQRTLTAMKEAASQANRHSGRHPWWTRRLSVPVPVAATFLLLFALALGRALDAGEGTPALPPVPGPVVTPRGPEPIAAPKKGRELAHSSPSATPQTFATALYVPKLGYVARQQVTYYTLEAEQ